MATTTAPKEGQIILKSSDGNDHPVDRSVAERSMLIKNLLTDLPMDDPSQAIPIPNVSSLLQSTNKLPRIADPLLQGKRYCPQKGLGVVRVSQE
jgi:Skp1 family, tetramerisation domain